MYLIKNVVIPYYSNPEKQTKITIPTTDKHLAVSLEMASLTNGSAAGRRCEEPKCFTFLRAV